MKTIPAQLPTLFQRLLGLLTGPDYEVRRAALVALSKLRGQMAAEIVFDRFKSDNLEDYLVFAMQTMDAERTARLLVTALNDPHLEVRVRAGEALARRPTEESVFALTQAVETYLNRNKLTESGQAALVTEEGLLGAARALGEIGNPMCMGLLRKLVLQETNAKIRATAVAALCLKPTDALMPILQGLLKDPDARVRANAIEGIQRLDKASAIGVLQPYLYDPHQRVRANAAKAIWKFGDYEVSSTIREMLANKDKRQVVSGIYAIGEIRQPTFFKNLTGYLANADADVRRNAVIALRKFARPESAPDLARMVADDAPEVRIQAAGALAEIDPTLARDTLPARLAAEPEAGVRAVLIGHLGRLGGNKGPEALARYLDDPDERVVLATIETLARLIPQEPSPTVVLGIEKHRAGKDRPLMRRAIWALWRWGFLDALDTVARELGSSDPEIQISALQTAGEIFAEVSERGPEILAGYDQCLRQTLDEFRRTMNKASSEAAEKEIQDLFHKVQEDIKEKRIVEARAGLAQILGLVPDHLLAWQTQGELHLAANELDEAERSLLRALELGPNTVKAQFALGQVYCRRGDWARAVSPLETTIRLYPKLPQAYLLLVDSLENLGRFPDAREVLRRLMALTAPHPVIQQRYARLCFLAGAVGEGLQAVRPLAGQAGLDLGTQVILALGDALDGQSRQAVQALLRLLAVATDPRAGRHPAWLPRLAQIAAEALARSGANDRPGH